MDSLSACQPRGLWAYPPDLFLINRCSFAGNVAERPAGESALGGALSGFNMELRNLTFVQNHAEFTGGAISNEGGAFTLDDCVFLDNTAANPWGTCQTCVHAMSGARNIQWPAPEGSEDPLCTAGAQAVDPRLGLLSDNGGGTDTIPLLEGSPAIDAAAECTDTDQRGEPRHRACDIGAFEAP